MLIKLYLGFCYYFSFFLFLILAFGQDACYVQGICKDSFTIDHLDAPSYLQCQSSCQQTNDCNYFTFKQSDDFCILYYNCTNIDATECPDCYTSQKDCLVCQQPGECQGNVLDYAFTQTVKDCEKECFDNSQCEWYTYELSHEYCFLTTGCIPRNSSSTNVFGQKNCYQEDIGTNPSKEVFSLKYSYVMEIKDMTKAQKNGKMS